MTARTKVDGGTGLADAARVLSALAAPGRLGLLATVAGRQEAGLDTTVDALATATRRDRRALLRDANRLTDCRVLRLHGGTFVADLDTLRAAAAAIDRTFPIAALLDEEPDLARFFQHGQLGTMPDNPDLRLRIAQLLVRLLPNGAVLPEAEVNRLLAQAHPDYAALRRMLVDYRLVTRDAASRYQRV